MWQVQDVLRICRYGRWFALGKGVRGVAGGSGKVCHYTAQQRHFLGSPAMPKSTVAFACRCATARAVLPAIEAELGRLGAVPHWGKVTTMAPATIAARIPRLADFRALVMASDPKGKFRNDFVNRMVFGGP